MEMTSSVTQSTTSEYSVSSVKDFVEAKRIWEHEDDRYRGRNSLFQTFSPNDTTKTCSTENTQATSSNLRVHGVNLGGLFVLEPWITPTLFYQFMGTPERFGPKAPEKTALDTYTFCTALGKDEANLQFRIHWANWVTEDDFVKLKKAGVNSVRIPLGDYMFVPYEPYIGCTDGSVDVLDFVIDLAHKYGMSVLLDIHAHIDSQNGFDNSGKTSAVKWNTTSNTKGGYSVTFSRWPTRVAEWMGKYDRNTKKYTSINYANLLHSLDAVTAIVERYASHPAVMGIQPVNEPWENTPFSVLKDFYWKGYKRVKALAPHWNFVMHDSFRFTLDIWAGFMKGCPGIALDTHIYQAWIKPGTQADYFSNACQQKQSIADMEKNAMPVIIGEWSLATDNCAMWLNGFNDNMPGYPKVKCAVQKCPTESTYLGYGFPGTPLDLNKPIQGPYGTELSGPSYGLCSITSTTAFRQEDDQELTLHLLHKRLNAWSAGHGWYFWNFKTELDYKWSFLHLYELGLFPKDIAHYANDNQILEACEKEDKGEFVCIAKRTAQDAQLEKGLSFACGAAGMDCSKLNKEHPTLLDRCNWAFNEYWHRHRREGATCDFDGTAYLSERRA
uniref:Glucan 1 putative n=1 Tax=Albugo laibachii Nc14 TaxID=890382 RepID=F0WMX6_9STRA|nr:glucan 1 putative [Albugo laibachii Nc14]|eukprot:CCA22662.1 glucan 1 putative [Albugo laibachii Nc14]